MYNMLMITRSASTRRTERSQMGTNTVESNQQGFAALIIAITLVVVVSLITVGFAQLAQNELKQNTNKQLSNQAYYAAESGVNDAAQAITNGYNQKKTTCPPLPTGSSGPGERYLTKQDVDGANSQWTCLLIDSQPSSVVFGSVSTINPTVFTARAVDASGNPKTFSTITIYWQDADANQRTFRSSSGVTNSSFPTISNWAATGLLRVGITPLGSLNRVSLIDNTFTAFLYPTKSSVPNNNNSVSYSNDPSTQGTIMDGKCDTSSTPRYCSATITGLNESTYLFNLRSIYSSTSVFISGTDASGAAVSLAGAQTMVDATGRAQNVLKRIQVRIPTNGEYYYPGFAAATTGDLCKQIQVWPGNGSDSCP